MADLKKKRKPAKPLSMTLNVRGTMGWYKRPWVLNYRETKPVVYKLQTVPAPVIGGDAIIAYAAKAANVPETTVRMAKEALFDAIAYFCANGRTVQVPNLGTFAVHTNVKAKPSAEEVTAESIKGRRIQFIPKAAIARLARMDNIDFVYNENLSKLALAAKPSEDNGKEEGQ